MYALVNDATGIVDHLVAYDGIAPYDPPDGYRLVEVPADTQQGARWADGSVVNPPTPLPQAEVAVAQQALIALAASDVTVLRCVETGAGLPAAWASYRQALRDVVAGRSTTLPTRPSYPVGT